MWMRSSVMRRGNGWKVAIYFLVNLERMRGFLVDDVGYLGFSQVGIVERKGYLVSIEDDLLRLILRMEQCRDFLPLVPCELVLRQLTAPRPLAHVAFAHGL